MQRKYITGILIFNLIGIIFAILSLHRHLTIMSKGLIAPSLCAISETINCDIVYASSFSTILGVPAATWGLGFYLSVFLIMLFTRNSAKNKDSAVSFIWWYSWLGVTATIYMFYVSQILLHAYCIYCIGMYIVNIATLILATLALPTMPKEFIPFIKNYLVDLFSKTGRRKTLFFKYSSATIVIVAIILLISNSLEAKKGKHPDIDMDKIVAAHFSQPETKIPFEREEKNFWGNGDGKIEIVEFSEFQCPFCRMAAFTVKPYIAEFKNHVRFYYLHFPLDAKCNPYVRSEMHAQACLMAQASICADRQGKFWQYHDEVFRNPRKYRHRIRLMELAEEFGLDADELNRCIDLPETAELIRKDAETGSKIDVHGVPRILINNRPLKLWKYPEVVRTVIREEIKRLEKQQ